MTRDWKGPRRRHSIRIGLSDDILQFLHRPVEAFHVSDVQHDAAPFGHLEQFLGFRQRGSDRLFDQHVHAGVEKLTGDLIVHGRRHRDADHVDFPQEIVVIRQRGGVIGIRQVLNTLRVNVDDPDQLHLRQFRQNSYVIPPHLTHPDHTSSHWASLPALKVHRATPPLWASACHVSPPLPAVPTSRPGRNVRHNAADVLIP